MDRIIGVIFPIPRRFVGRLLYENRNIFVKYVGRPTSLSLAPKQKVLFYVSHSSKEIAGEGVIQQVDLLTPDQAISRFGSRLFLDESELRKYTLQQPGRDYSKKMLVLTLTRIKKYKRPRKYAAPITMAGKRLTKEEYRRLITQALDSHSSQ